MSETTTKDRRTACNNGVARAGLFGSNKIS